MKTRIKTTVAPSVGGIGMRGQVMVEQNASAGERDQVVNVIRPQQAAGLRNAMRPPKCVFVSLFCGAGGDTTGALRAIEELGFGTVGIDIRVIAVNHDPQALTTHAANHPNVEHWDSDIEKLDPQLVLQRLDPELGLQRDEITVLWQSAPCQDWSVAAGGPVKRPHKRATPEWMREWVRKGRPKVIIEENVREVQKKWPGWAQHLKELRDMGYRVEVREPDFADYGVPQNRKRMIMVAVRDDQPIAWPKQTHSKVGKDGQPTIPGTLPHRGAIEGLDLSLPCPSIYARTKKGKGKKGGRIPWPYEPMTRERVARYVREKGRFWNPVAEDVEASSGPTPLLKLVNECPEEEWPSFVQRHDDHLHIYAAELEEPFLSTWNRNGDGRSIHQPSTAVTAGGQHQGVVQPRLQVIDPALLGIGGTGQQKPRSAGKPARTKLTESHMRVATFMLGQQQGAVPRETASPSNTVATAAFLRVAELRCVLNGADNPERWEHVPGGVACSFGILPTRGRSGGPAANPARGADRTAPNVMAEQTLPRVVEVRLGVGDPALIPSHGEAKHQAPRLHRAKNPAPTVATCALPRIACMDIVYTYNGNANVRSASAPNTTVTTVERHMVIEVRIEDLSVDVGLRMCAIKEVAAFQTFPTDYVFTGTKEDMQRHIGNAVPPQAAYHFVKAALSRKGMIRYRLQDFAGSASADAVGVGA